MITKYKQSSGLLRKKDKKFLEDAIADIKINLDNVKYSVDELARNMSISRSQLYNKVHSTTGLSPKTFIRIIRLEEAKSFLEQGDLNVSEISYKVGFNSTTYFNKCFHDYFGYTPGEIQKVRSESLHYTDTLDQLIATNKQGISGYRKILISGLKISGGLIILLIAFYIFIQLITDPKADFSQKSIAILPFTYTDSIVDGAYLEEGITKAILDKLARIEALKVISITSAGGEKQSEADYTEIAHDIGVSYILSGEIMKSGRMLSINVHLVDARENTIIWQKYYHNDYYEVFTVQSDIVKSITDQIDINITSEEQSDISKPQTIKIESYDQFQKGLPYFRSYILNQKQNDFKQAMNHFSRAITIDSTYADVYPHIAQLLWIKNYRKNYYSDSFMDSVKILCEFALTLNPNLSFAHCLLGQYYWETGKPVKGISLLEKALSLNNSNELAHFHLGYYYSWMGEWEKALPHLHASIALAPFSVFLPIRYSRIAVAYMDIGDFKKADSFAIRALNLTGDNNPASKPGYFVKTHSRIVTGRWDEALEYSNKLLVCDTLAGLRYRAEIYSHYLRNFPEAIKLYEHLESIDPYYPNYKHRYAYALWMNGNQEKANKLFDEQIQQYEKEIDLGRIGRHDPNYNLAGIHAFRGNLEVAIRLLFKYQFQSGLEYYITHDPLFENLWSNKDFQDLVIKVRTDKSKIRARVSKKY